MIPLRRDVPKKYFLVNVIKHCFQRITFNYACSDLIKRAHRRNNKRTIYLKEFCEGQEKIRSLGRETEFISNENIRRKAYTMIFLLNKLNHSSGSFETKVDLQVFKEIDLRFVQQQDKNNLRMFFCPTTEQFYSQPMTIVFFPSYTLGNPQQTLPLNFATFPLNTIFEENKQEQDNIMRMSGKNSNSEHLVTEQYLESPKQNEGKKMDRIKKQEEQFKPYIQGNKNSRRSPQNANRNVIPNIMHQVISFLQKKSKSQKTLVRIINKLGVSHICTPKRFYLYQVLIKDKLNHYLNAESLIVLKNLQQPSCQVYSEEEQRLYNKISRILVQHFLTMEYESIILTSKRVHSNKRQDHIMTKRKLVEQFAQMFTA